LDFTFAHIRAAMRDIPKTPPTTPPTIPATGTEEDPEEDEVELVEGPVFVIVPVPDVTTRIGRSV